MVLSAFFCLFYSCFSSPTMRLPKRWRVLIERLSDTFNTCLTKTHLCADVTHMVKWQPQFASPPWCCSQRFYFAPFAASFSGNLSSCLPLPLALFFCLSCSLFAVGRQASRQGWQVLLQTRRKCLPFEVELGACGTVWCMISVEHRGEGKRDEAG